MLVQGALGRLRERGCTTVELGAWATPLLWHGVPEDCSTAKDFFGALGWSFYEESADLTLDLACYHTSAVLLRRVTEYGTALRPSRDDEGESVLEFVHREFPTFVPYYEDELSRAGTRFILVACTGPRIDATIIISKFPQCSGAHWHRLLGTQFGVMGATVVRRSERGRGIGLALTAYALDEQKRLGCEMSYLHWTWMIQMYGQLGATVWRRYSLGRLAV